MSSRFVALAYLRRLITPPVFDDEEKNRRAGLLYVISLTLLAILILTTISIWGD